MMTRLLPTARIMAPPSLSGTHDCQASAERPRPAVASLPVGRWRWCLAVLAGLICAGSAVQGANIADLPTIARPLHTAVQSRYETPARLPEFTAADYGPAGLYGPPAGTYYAPRSRVWVQADYLLWWAQGQGFNRMVLDGAGNSLLGGGRVNDASRDGIRIRGGYFFDDDALCGLMVDYWSLGSTRDNGAVDRGTNGTSDQVMSFTDMDLTLPSNQHNGCVCIDDLVGTAATMPIDRMELASKSNLWGGSALLRGRWSSAYACGQNCGCCRYGYRLDGLAGYRYLDLDEAVQLSTRLTPTTGAVSGVDRFTTDNEFHGVDVGVIGERECGRWAVEALGRFGMGVNHQTLTVAGTGSRQGGIFAQTTNSGVFEHDHFAVIPEANLNLTYTLTCNVRARCGYSFLWVSNVVRPAKQIDTRIDGRLLDVTQSQPITNPPAFFPAQKFDTESLWLQGLNFGVEAWF